MYIFGYGSLINATSRQLTGQTGEAIPAIAHGLVRYWGKVDESYSLSPLVVSQGTGQVNGVLLKVEDEALAEFDQRERGYQRVALSNDQIETQHPLNKHSTIWVYVTEHVSPPCSHSPIVQTYVDTVLAGCLDISDSFAHHFIEHTLGWHSPWENDRHDPKYGNLARVNPIILPRIDALIANFR